MKKDQAVKFWRSLDNSTSLGDVVSDFNNKKGYTAKRTLQRYVQAAECFRQGLSLEDVASRTGWRPKMVNKIRTWWEEEFSDTQLTATLFLRMERIKEHLSRMKGLRDRLRSEIWTPPMNTIPQRNLNACRDVYFENTVHWKYADNGEFILKLDVEDEDDYGCFGRHTYNAEFWDNLTEWKYLGGIYISDRADLLNAICEDVETETGMQVVSDDGTRGVLEGYFYEIFLNVFSLNDTDVPPKNRSMYDVRLGLI